MSEEQINSPEEQAKPDATPEVAQVKPEAAKAPKAPKAKPEAAKADTEAAGEPAAPVRVEQPTAADLLKADVGSTTIRRAKGSKNVTAGTVHIFATFNNTKVAFTDKQGNVISWSSSGKMHFRGSRKSTAYAAQIVTQDAGRVAMSHGMKEVEVRVKGPGMGRDSAIRALQGLGFSVSNIIDVTPVPHNGCRAPKRRRV